MTRSFLVALVLLSAGGCQKPKPPAYTLTIPDDVPGPVVLRDKDGVEHATNGRDMYAKGFERGWNRCWGEHLAGKLKLWNDDESDKWIEGGFIIFARGLVDGFKACQKLIRENPAIQGG